VKFGGIVSIVVALYNERFLEAESGLWNFRRIMT